MLKWFDFGGLDEACDILRGFELSFIPGSPEVIERLICAALILVSAEIGNVIPAQADAGSVKPRGVLLDDNGDYLILSRHGFDSSLRLC